MCLTDPADPRLPPRSAPGVGAAATHPPMWAAEHKLLLTIAIDVTNVDPANVDSTDAIAGRPHLSDHAGGLRRSAVAIGRDVTPWPVTDDDFIRGRAIAIGNLQGRLAGIKRACRDFTYRRLEYGRLDQSRDCATYDGPLRRMWCDRRARAPMRRPAS